MLSSVAALSPAGYASPMALPQSRVAASMVDINGLKDLAKSQNPVVVSRRTQQHGATHGHRQPHWPPNPNPYPVRRATTTR